MRNLALAVTVCAAVTFAAPPPMPGDAGAKLTAPECEALLDAMMTLAVTESLNADADVQKMNAETKAATAKLARKQALSDPKLSELKKECPTRYSAWQRDCIMQAKTMNEVDVCSKR